MGLIPSFIIAAGWRYNTLWNSSDSLALEVIVRTEIEKGFGMMDCHHKREANMWLRTCAIFVLCRIVWSSVFLTHAVQNNVFHGTKCSSCWDNAFGWVQIVCMGAYWCSEGDRLDVARKACWKCYREAWARHVVVEDLLGYEVVADGQHCQGGERFTGGEHWKAQQNFERDEQRSDYSTQWLELFRNDMTVRVPHAFSVTVRLALKMMRKTSLWMGSLCGWQIYVLGIGLL